MTLLGVFGRAPNLSDEKNDPVIPDRCRGVPSVYTLFEEGWKGLFKKTAH